MHIEHLAIWCQDIEQMKLFYQTYFGAKSNEKYVNPKKQFESYFLTFDSGARLEVMQKVEIPNNQHDRYIQAIGLAHFALSVGSKEKVDSLTHQLQADGYEIVSAPRWTGDGYYESVVFDPEKNQIELTI